MHTKQLYLDDSYLKEMDAVVLQVLPEGENRWRLLLDSTVFYAMGGGQATDQGMLRCESWTGKVYQVMVKDGELWHYVQSASAPALGEKLHGEIDWLRRYKSMRLHSAGHLIDFALYLLGYSPKHLQPQKADHTKKPFIAYQGTLEQDISATLQAKVNKLIAQDLKFSWEFLPYEQLVAEALYLQPNLPTNKPLRALRLESVGTVADGGTQVRSTAELGTVRIDSITSQDNLTTIRYSLGE